MAERHIREFLHMASRKAEAHREICGVIVDNGWLLELVRLPNRTRRRGGFLTVHMDLKLVEQATRRLGHRVVGSCHSHPVSATKPGPGDIRGAEAGSLMLVIDCIGREARLWRIGRNRRAYAVHLNLM
jgi:proteasome lid subunit RPN8/RPN11